MAEAIATVGGLAGVCGHDGTNWQKLGLVWAYNDVVSEIVTDNDLAAGTNHLDGTTVPAGEVWVITAICGYYKGSSATGLLLKATAGGEALNLRTEYPPTTQQWYVITGNFVLKEDDFVRVTIEGATSGDDGQLRYGGYKMKLSM